MYRARLNDPRGGAGLDGNEGWGEGAKSPV